MCFSSPLPLHASSVSRRKGLSKAKSVGHGPLGSKSKKVGGPAARKQLQSPVVSPAGSISSRLGPFIQSEDVSPMARHIPTMSSPQMASLDERGKRKMEDKWDNSPRVKKLLSQSGIAFTSPPHF